MSQVLQWTQLDGFRWSRTFPGLAASGTISYTFAGQKCWQGFPYSSRQRVTQIEVSCTIRWLG